jgi:hypothetical protein
MTAIEEQIPGTWRIHNRINLVRACRDFSFR